MRLDKTSATWTNASPQLLGALSDVGGPSFKEFIQASLYDEVAVKDSQSVLRGDSPGIKILRSKCADILREPMTQAYRQLTELMKDAILPELMQKLGIDPKDEYPTPKITAKLSHGDATAQAVYKELQSIVSGLLTDSPELKQAFADCAALLKDYLGPLAADNPEMMKEVMAKAFNGLAMVGITGEFATNSAAITDKDEKTAALVSNNLLILGFAVTPGPDKHIQVPFSNLVPGWDNMLANT
jgi:hypothetical protein